MDKFESGEICLDEKGELWFCDIKIGDPYEFAVDCQNFLEYMRFKYENEKE